MKDDAYRRLVERPVFILSSIRSGSTLLRCLMNTHSQILAPHELHLTHLGVDVPTWYTEQSLRAAGLSAEEMQYLLWDRILHRLLSASGKSTIVDKTPGNALSWRRLHECWPRARYIFLLRHPANIVASAIALEPEPSKSDIVQLALSMVDGVDEARTELDGLTVRYEDLAADPTNATQAVCAHLGLTWEPGMLDYGRGDHGPFAPGLGDFGEAIRSGRVQPSKPMPPGATVPEHLRDRCARWGYEV